MQPRARTVIPGCTPAPRPSRYRQLPTVAGHALCAGRRHRGKALSITTTLTRGIVQAQESISDYYIIGYYTTNTARNGHFRG